MYVLRKTFSLVQFSGSVMSDFLRPHGLQHARPPCPSSTAGVYPNPCPLGPWCHPAISSSVVPFSSCPQPFPASGSFQMSQLFASGGQSIGVSTSSSVFPMNTQDWSLLGLIGLISLQSKGLSGVLSNTTVQKTLQSEKTGRGRTDRAQCKFKTVRALAISWWLHVFMRMLWPITCTTPRVDTNVCSELWMTMMC